MTDIVLSVSQVMQVIALVPCLFVILYLLLAVRIPKVIIIPVVYFLSMACGLLQPLLTLFPPPYGQESVFESILLFGESYGPALSFLLILQFIYGQMPPLYFWSVLAIPALGGSWFVYTAMLLEDACILPELCIPAEALKTLYNLLASALIFLLLTVLYSRLAKKFLTGNSAARRSKAILILALIALNLCLLATDLIRITNIIPAKDATFTATMIRIGFIYLVLSSLFRVFYQSFHIPNTFGPSQSDLELADKIRAIFDSEQRPYCEQDFNRDALARMLNVNETSLSRAINRVFDKSFSELANDYRVGAAKDILTNQPDVPVTNIAFDTGFNSIASFNRVFRRHTGMTPTEYRKSEKATS